MDKIDRQIIELLHADARLSLRELSDKVHLSANTVGERIKRLQQSKVLLGFHAALDMAALGRPLQALIDIKLMQGSSAQDFEAALSSIPGVLEATLMTGNYDYMLRVACIDQADLVRLIEALRERAKVKETYSRLILRQVEIRSPLT